MQEDAFRGVKGASAIQAETRNSESAHHLDNEQEQAAIQEHSRKASWFADEYRKSLGNTYADCFIYSRKRLDEVLNAVVPTPSISSKLLEVGCGSGHYLWRYAAAGYSVAGVDGSSEMLQLARENNPGADLRQSTVNVLPFPTAQFDVVLCIEVLRYLPDLQRCIAEMARVTASGGVYIATAQPYLNANGYWLVNSIASRFQTSQLSSLRQFFVRPSHLAKQFLDAGFRSAKIVNVYTGPVNWVERLAGKRIQNFLRWWEPLDAALCKVPAVTPFANMIVIHGVK